MFLSVSEFCFCGYSYVYICVCIWGLCVCVCVHVLCDRVLLCNISLLETHSQAQTAL